MTIQVVFFDMGGTIETFARSRERNLQATPGLQQIFHSAGIDLNFSDEQLYQFIMAGMERYHAWRLKTLEELPSEQICSQFIFKDTLVDHAIPAALAEDVMFFIETQYYQREMRPEIPQVLEAIRKMGLKMGIISNVSSKGQVPACLAHYGIQHYFDPVILSSEYGRRKPDPAIFHYAARCANVPTSRCLYVGDRIARDIVGARKAGIKFAVQIRHDFEHGEDDSGATPDKIIGNMSELLDFLRLHAHQPDHEPAGLIRAFLFDAGDILYFRPRRDIKVMGFLKDLALDVSDSHEKEKQALIQQAYRGQINQEQYREAFLRMYGVTRPEHLEHGKQLLEEEDNDVQFFEAVPQTLLTLKELGYFLGIVTDTANSISAKLRWFEAGGFAHVWDSVISSREIGVRKPNPVIYRAALRQLGLSAGQVVFVGHKPSELKGARAVGMKTIAFNHDEGAVADEYIDNFSDLLNASVIRQFDQVPQ